MDKTALLYFVKYPEPGKVKTRLASSVGFREAARLYKKLAEENLEILRSLPQDDFKIFILFSPPESKPLVEKWLGINSFFVPQRGKDLGERLSHAFQFAFNQKIKKVMISRQILT